MQRVIILILLIVFLASPTAFARINFGDHASSTLTTKAWEALGRADLDAAMTYANKCIEMYEEEARKMQTSLQAFPANEPKEETFKYWALNDVGTAYFIKGEILMKQSNPAAAKAAYEKLAREFSYAQCWDTRGWFWKPGEAAKQKVLEIGFDEE
jgi:tetratricopeptide (TPR) repeat protein